LSSKIRRESITKTILFFLLLERPGAERKTKYNGGKKIAKKDLNKLSFEDLKKELETLEKQKTKATVKQSGFYQLGEPYMIRTVTMIYTGRLVKASNNELVLTECSWIPDTGRWMSACESGTFDEVEPYPKDAEVIVNREAVLDLFKIDFKLPEEQK